MIRNMASAENVLQPGKTYRVDADKFGAVKAAMMKVIPNEPPGLTIAALKALILPHLPEALFPGGAKAGWWIKSVQLDLVEAKGVITRSAGSPLRWRIPYSWNGAQRTLSRRGRITSRTAKSPTSAARCRQLIAFHDKETTNVGRIDNSADNLGSRTSHL